jgi:SAM-dependent methyltransferase
MHAKCPECGALERHRLQYLVLAELLEKHPTSSMTMLHFAPERMLAPLFAGRFGCYETADVAMDGVDHRVDLQALPFESASYDFVFASHVLEHIPDDMQSISEIRRVLRPGGIAVLPVPLVAERTIEYLKPLESHHVRAPGLDYFDRFLVHFARVDRRSSADFPEKYQLYTYEDRMAWPTPASPMLQPMPGLRHIDIMPVCYV